jgi:hypothetical protein
MIIDDDDNTVLIHSDLVIYKKMVMDFGGFCDGLFDEICVCVVGCGNWFLRVKLSLMKFSFFSLSVYTHFTDSEFGNKSMAIEVHSLFWIWDQR